MNEFMIEYPWEIWLPIDVRVDDLWYRIETDYRIVTCGSVDQDEVPVPRLIIYIPQERTRKGLWLKAYHAPCSIKHKRVWIGDDWRLKPVWPTVEEAITSYRIRREKYAKILKRRLKITEIGIRHMNPDMAALMESFDKAIMRKAEHLHDSLLDGKAKHGGVHKVFG